MDTEIKEYFNKPVEERKLQEMPCLASQCNYESLVEATFILHCILDEIQKALFDESKEGFRLVVYYDKKSSENRAKIKLWELTSQQGRDECNSPAGRL